MICDVDTALISMDMYNDASRLIDSNFDGRFQYSPSATSLDEFCLDASVQVVTDSGCIVSRIGMQSEESMVHILFLEAYMEVSECSEDWH